MWHMENASNIYTIIKFGTSYQVQSIDSDLFVLISSFHTLVKFWMSASKKNEIVQKFIRFETGDVLGANLLAEMIREVLIYSYNQIYL